MSLSVRGVVTPGEDRTHCPCSRRSQLCVRLRLLGKIASRRDPSSVREGRKATAGRPRLWSASLGRRPLVARFIQVGSL
jgi:hypothetical protein